MRERDLLEDILERHIHERGNFWRTSMRGTFWRTSRDLETLAEIRNIAYIYIE